MQEIVSQTILPIVLATIMLAMGMSLTLDNFKRTFLQPKTVLLGLTLQLLLLPCIAIIIAYIFSLSATASAGLFLLALCPGGATSNLFSYLAKGNLALSVTLTAITSILIPFTLPLLFSIYVELIANEQQTFSMPLTIMIKQLFIVTVVPIFIGMFLRYNFTKAAIAMEKNITIVTALAMFIVIILLLATNKNAITNMVTSNGLAALSLCCFSLLLSYIISTKMLYNIKDVKTITIEVGVQNAGTAMMVALTLINQPQLAIIPLMYGLLMNIPTCSFVWWAQQQNAPSTQTN